jgi:voltage-gated potassium channel
MGHQGFPAGRVFDLCLLIIILINIAAIALDTVPEYTAAAHGLFRTVETVVVAIFSVEYLARLWVSVEDPKAEGHNRLAWRLRYMATPFAVIDLVAILPFYLEVFLGVAPEFTILLRVLRLFKILRFTGAFDLIFSVIQSERRSLMAAMVVIGINLLLISTVAYLAERTAQPDKFGSIPDAFYWGIITLATVGYGDLTPVTPLGRFMSAVGAVLGILSFAMPAGIIASGFIEEMRRRDFMVTWQLVAKVPLFQRLSAARIASVVHVLKPKRVPAGIPVVTKGDHADAMYFVVSGLLDVELPNEKVRLGQGTFFGEMSLLESGDHTTTVRAATDCQLLVLDGPEFRLLLANAPELADEVQRVIDERKHHREQHERRSA